MARIITTPPCFETAGWYAGQAVVMSVHRRPHEQLHDIVVHHTAPVRGVMHSSITGSTTFSDAVDTAYRTLEHPLTPTLAVGFRRTKSGRYDCKGNIAAAFATIEQWRAHETGVASGWMCCA